MDPIANFKTKLFGDGADKATMLSLYKDSRIQGFTTSRGGGLREDDGSAGCDSRLSAQLATQTQAGGARQVEGKNDRVGRRPLELLQQRGRGVRLDDAVAALNEHRLERPGEPLLGITDEHHRGTTGCGWTARHGNGTLGADRPATQPPVKRATRRTRRACWLQ